MVNDGSNGASDGKIRRDGGDGIGVTCKIGMKTSNSVRGTATHDAAFGVLTNKEDNVLESFEVGVARSGLKAREMNTVLARVHIISRLQASNQRQISPLATEH